MRRRTWIGLLLCGVALTVHAAEPLVVDGEVVITEPTEVGDVVVLDGGVLRVEDVPEPGFQLAGNLFAVGDGEVHLDRSVVRVLSQYHGQYVVGGIDDARFEISHCDYRSLYGVQHAVVASGHATVAITDSDFGDTQLIAAEDGTLAAERTNGRFEVIVQHRAAMTLRDLPRDPGQGEIWVWVEFGPGSRATYTPPPPGPVAEWRFPDPSMAGIPQSIVVERCDVLLWPMLVREGSDLILADIPPSSWVVVGLHLPVDTVIEDLVNDRTVADGEVVLPDRRLRLSDATVDTWNLYPQGTAHVTVRDSRVGEVLALEDSTTHLLDTVVDGTGGFFGTRDRARLTAAGCRITCTVEATAESTLRLVDSVVEPYEADPGGRFTRFGAYDSAVLVAEHTTVDTTPALGGDGVIAAVWLDGSEAGGELAVWGALGLYSLEGGPGFAGWRVLARPVGGGAATVVAAGDSEVTGEPLGTAPIPAHRATLVAELTDGRGRTIRAVRHLTPAGPASRSGCDRP